MRTKFRPYFRVAIFALGLSAFTVLRAEVPPVSDAQLADDATLIATGFVTTVSNRDDTSYPGGRMAGALVTTHYTVTMEVSHVEKGSLSSSDHSLQFTGSFNTRVPAHWVGGTNTMRLEVRPGDEIKVYLRREGDHWVLFHHSGLWLRR